MTQTDLIDLLEHNDWANERILTCANQLSTEQLISPANFDYQSAFQTLRHILDVEWSWRVISPIAGSRRVTSTFWIIC